MPNATFTYQIGGDDITSDANLYYKIYNFGVLFHTTGTSINDSNVSVNAGVATVINVPVDYSTTYNFTMSEVDEGGLESTPSSTIVFVSSDAFAITGIEILSNGDDYVQVRTLMNQQCKISYYLDGILHPASSELFDAYEYSPGLFRHTKILNTLIPGTTYSMVIVVENGSGITDTSSAQDITTTGTVPVGVLPTLSNFRIENAEPSKVYFDSSSSIAGMTATGFTISGKSISSITVNGTSTTGHYFTVSSPFVYGLIVNIECLGGDGTILDSPKNYVANNVAFAGTERYVTPTGAGSKTGVDEANAWSLTELNAATISGGTRINIKKGTYTAASASGVIILDNGTAGNPVIYEGYDTNPGDISFSPTYGTALSATNMPLFVGNNTATNNLFVECVGKHDFVIKNIQAKQYYNGFRNFGTTATYNAYFDNVALEEFGTVSFTNAKGWYLQNRSEMSPYNYNIQLKDCYVNTTSNTNYWVDGDDCFLYNCKSYSDELTSVGADTDYLFSCWYGYNVVWRNLYAEKVGDTAHDGHGFDFKSSESTGIGDAAFGVFDSFMINCSIKNVSNSVSFRHSKVQRNQAINIEVDGTGGNTTGGIVFRDGASFNTVDRCKVSYPSGSSYGGISFFDSSGEDGANQLCEGNIVKNSIFLGNVNFQGAIHFASSGSAMQIKDNKFYNNSFLGFYQVYRSYAVLTDLLGTEFKNNLVTNITRYEHDSNVINKSGFNFNNYYNCSGTIPDSTYTTLNPNFVDTVDYVPQEETMTAAKITGVDYDYNGKERASTTTIGAVALVSE